MLNPIIVPAHNHLIHIQYIHIHARASLCVEKGSDEEMFFSTTHVILVNVDQYGGQSR